MGSPARRNILLLPAALLGLAAIGLSVYWTSGSSAGRPPVARPVDRTEAPAAPPAPVSQAVRYQLFADPLTWAQARQRCLELGGRLASIQTKDQNDLIAALLPAPEDRPKYFWLGLMRDRAKDQWIWVGPRPLRHANWFDEEAVDPDAGGDYGAMASSKNPHQHGHWKDFAGPDTVSPDVAGFVCEFDVDDAGVDRTPAGAAVFRGHRYAYFRDSVSWFWAMTRCQDMGGHLVTISSKEENDFVSSLLPRERDTEAFFWIGMTDELKKFSWEWITGEKSKYRNWRPGEPNNAGGNEDFVAMTSSPNGAVHGTWVDLEGPQRVHGIVAGFVCEWDEQAAKPAGGEDVKAGAAVWNGHRYAVLTRRVTQSQAKAECERMGGHLLCLETKEEWAFVTSTLFPVPRREVFYWIGLSEADAPGEWRWDTKAKMGFSRWLPGEPSNTGGKEHFTAMLASMDEKAHGGWNDFEGPNQAHDAIVGFVCEWDK